MNMIGEELEEIQVAEDYFHLQACICFVVGLAIGLAFKVASIWYERTEQDPASLWQQIRRKTADFFTCRPHIAMAMAQPLPRTKNIPIDTLATQPLDTWTSDLERNVQWRIMERDVKAHRLSLTCRQSKPLEADISVDGQEDTSETTADEIKTEILRPQTSTSSQSKPSEADISEDGQDEIYEEISDVSKAELTTPKIRERRELRWIEVVERTPEEMDELSNWQKYLCIGLVIVICLVVLVLARQNIATIFEKVFLEQIHDFITQKIITLSHFK